jgi:hypothetical protein
LPHDDENANAAVSHGRSLFAKHDIFRLLVSALDDWRNYR